MKAKKSLGQHFLKSEKALRSIVSAGDVNADDVVLEIGPGRGELTSRLMLLGGKVIAVEKDDMLERFLREKYKEEIKENHLDLVHGDILEFDPNLLKFYKEFSYKLIANIPYNITGAILRKFLSADYQPELMVLLVQKEVAERIVTRDGKESILSLSIKAYGEPRFIETVKAGSFAPAPKVDSAILLIENISKKFFQDFSEKDFFKLVQTGFKSKRKKLSSNLATVYPKEKIISIFEELKVNSNVRAEDLALKDWKELSKRLFN